MMSKDTFRARLAEIDQTYNDNREGAEAARDQAMSHLFVECAWTQEMIAAEMGQSQQWVSCRLRLGRFLDFTTTGSKSFLPPQSLTERRFRTHWERVGKGNSKETETGRFGRVLESLQADTAYVSPRYRNLVKKPGIKKAVIAAITDTTARNVAQIAAIVSETIPGTDANQVGDAIQNITKSPPAGMKLQASHNGKSHRYRLKRVRDASAPAVQVDPERAGAVAVDAMPLIERCIEEMQKPEIRQQQTLVLDFLQRVQRMLSHLLIPEEVA
jgi:hypothetical protein